jgi:hypothetical protein
LLSIAEVESGFRLSFLCLYPARLVVVHPVVRLSALRLALRLNFAVTVLAAAAIATGATAGILRPGLIVFIIPLPLVFIHLGVALIPQFAFEFCGVIVETITSVLLTMFMTFLLPFILLVIRR